MSRTLVLLCVLSSLSLSSMSSLAGSAHAAPPPPPPIVGGIKVAPGAWPDVVAVLGRSGACTGTLIAPDVVLTAGHCIDTDPLEVVIDTIDYRQPGPGERIRVAWSRAYPNWIERYDVGVLMLERAAQTPPRAIASACHANAQLAASVPVRIVGFGLTTPGGVDSNTELHEATVALLDPFCEAMPGCEPAIAPKGEFAAGGRGTDSCFGDSGGPALIDTEDGPVLVGVVSRGLAIAGAPCGNGGIYVRADKVVSWIQRVTGRTLLRTTCAGRTDDPGRADELAAGGCSAGGGGGVGAGMLLALLALVGRRWWGATAR